MKFGALKNGCCYAAQYNPTNRRVEIIDTDPDLFTLMERHGYVSSDERDSDQGRETVENVQELLSEEEKWID